MAFVIYSKQADVFRTPILNRFLKRVAALVTECYPEEASKMADEELNEKIVSSFNVSERLGFTTEIGAVRFIFLSFTLGVEFYKKGEFAKLYNIKWVNQDDCMDFIYESIENIRNEKESWVNQETNEDIEEIVDTLINNEIVNEIDKRELFILLNNISNNLAHNKF